MTFKYKDGPQHILAVEGRVGLLKTRQIYEKYGKNTLEFQITGKWQFIIEKQGIPIILLKEKIGWSFDIEEIGGSYRITYNPNK